MTVGPVACAIFTKRLVLRPCTVAGNALLQASLSQEDERHEWFQLMDMLASAPATAQAWIIERNSRSAGVIALMGLSQTCAEIGFMVLSTERNVGCATEAASAVCSHAYQQLGIHRLSATTLSTNTCAARVLEHCAFQREGVMRDSYFDGSHYRDCILHARLSSDAAPAR